MNNSLIHEMIDNQFPFGVLKSTKVDWKKILIKKRINFKNQNEYIKIKQKIDKLKLISHKNTINLRSTQQNQKYFIDLYYPYVPLSLEEYFNENSGQIVRQLHKQFIQLAIYLAKHYILISFKPSSCGVIINDKKALIKYFLPINQIVITDNISTLQRSVQLFNLQSMHYLDTLSQNTISILENSSQPSFQARSHIYIGQSRKLRKDSQPVALDFNSPRKLSTFNPIGKQMRKLSHLSKQISQFSQMRKKKTKQSTRIGSFYTIKNIFRQDSSCDLKNFISQTKIIKQRVLKLKQRSFAAIKDFNNLKYLISRHRSLSLLINQIKK